MGYTGDAKREYQRQWLANRRAKVVELLGGECVGCGTTSDLEFDHIDPTTKDQYLKNGAGGKFLSRSWVWIVEELKKCQLLCQSCHTEKTNLAYPERKHGTRVMYQKSKCRCLACKEAAASYMKNYRKQK